MAHDRYLPAVFTRIEMTHEIFQSIHGIDRARRSMTSAEITALTEKKNGGQGDWFAQFLARTSVADRQLSLRGLLTGALHGKPYQAFAVADGIHIIYDHANPETPLNSVDRNLRFVIVALPDSDKWNPLLARTLFIVASDLVGTDNTTYLQCASWDPHALAGGSGLFRFYQRGPNGWDYFGDSFNAFTIKSVNRGVFEGHVGGALVMKELTRPWPHWYTPSTMANFKDSLGSTRSTASKCDPNKTLYDGLFTTQFGHPFDKLGTAESLEPLVRASVLRWYKTRYYANFVFPSQTDGTLTTKAIKSWVSHILLSNGTNIAASETATAQIKKIKVDIGAPPITLFINLHALQAVLPDVAKDIRWDFTIKNDAYKEAVEELKLSLYYYDLTSMESKIAVADTEGPFAFSIIEPGIEDYQAVSILATNSVTLLPKKAIAAMLMIDFWNPMYSAKRAKLMAYLPETATFDAPSKTYDFLPQFIEKVTASAESKTKDTPEYDILDMLKLGDDAWETAFTERVNAYLLKVHARLIGHAQKAAVMDYMILAEGRRRLYQGWQTTGPSILTSGLYETRMTLPIAARTGPFPFKEMAESGNVSEIDPTLKDETIKGAVKRAGKCPAHG